MKKMIRQSLSQYYLILEENEAENVYSLLMERIQNRRYAEEGEWHEIIEDEVYAFITNT